MGMVGKVQSNFPKEERREGGDKNTHSVPTRARTQTWDLSCAKQESPAARHGCCLDKQAFPCL